MLRKLFISTCIAIAVFCTASYVSVMVSLLSRTGRAKPVSNIGFPFRYYEQVWLRNSDSPNWGWSFYNFVLDWMIIWIVSTGIVLYTTQSREEKLTS